MFFSHFLLDLFLDSCQLSFCPLDRLGQPPQLLLDFIRRDEIFPLGKSNPLRERNLTNRDSRGNADSSQPEIFHGRITLFPKNYCL